MKPLIVSLFLVAAFTYTDSGRAAREVADAEFAFAKTSRESNTVNAFLRYLADDAIMFRQGEPVDGLTLWRGRTADSTLLNWWPVVADASESGDLGYTTGPYQFFNERTDRVPVGNGYYSTIWQRQADRTWRIKVDLGVRLDTIRALPQELVFASTGKVKSHSAPDIKTVDGNHNANLNRKFVSFDQSALAKNFRIHRALIGSVVNNVTAVATAEKGMSFRFEFVNGAESAARDFAYSYGKVVRKDLIGERKSNYLRVWRIENGKWKLVLDVITEG